MCIQLPTSRGVSYQYQRVFQGHKYCVIIHSSSGISLHILLFSICKLNCINKAGNQDIRHDNSDLISLAPSWILVTAITNIWLLSLNNQSHSLTIIIFFWFLSVIRGLKCKFSKSTLCITQIECWPSVFHITMKNKKENSIPNKIPTFNIKFCGILM